MANLKFNARHGLSVGSTPVDVVDSSGLIATTSIPALDASKIASGLIDAARLPSYVDDVLESANLASLPAIGEAGKIYVALDTNKTYRWSGSAYINVSSNNTFVQTTTPGTTGSPYLWVQTGLGVGGTSLTFWVEDGQ